MIRAVIFDLNGVFIKSPLLSERFEAEFGIPPEKFLPALREIMEKVRRPDAGDAFRYWEKYLKKEWKLNLSKKQFFDFWFNAEKESKEMIRVARELKAKNIRLFILSNNFMERADYYEDNFRFLDELFDKIYYSWQTGFVKPDTRAFKKVLSDNNLKAKECVYVDNQKGNIDSAKRLGMRTILFTNFKGAEAKLKNITASRTC